MSDAFTTATRLIVGAAANLGAGIEEAPATWSGDRFNAELLTTIARGSSLDRTDRDLPKSLHALKLDGTPVLIGELNNPAQRNRVHDALRRYRNQSTIARSWLGAAGPNLQLFLVGPFGTAADAIWRQLAAEAEADDRVCRKLVWLPPQDPSVHDAEKFLGRTFLARPWDGRPKAPSERLDRMADIDLPTGWGPVVDDDTLEADALIARLIELTRE